MRRDITKTRRVPTRRRSNGRAGRFPVFFIIGLMLLPTAMAAGGSDASGPREVLRLFGLDTSTMRQFTDRQPLSADEFEPIYRVLYLLPRLEHIDVFRWRQPFERTKGISVEPDAARGEIYHLQGWVTSIESSPLPKESARRFDYEQFYRIQMKSSSGLQSFVICARSIPKAWQTKLTGATNLQIPASCDAMFLKVGQPNPEEGSTADQFVFATQHVAWHAFEPEPELGINSGKALLGRGGMDVSQFDFLEQEKSIGHDDRECFYQLLWAVARLDPLATLDVAESQFEIAELLKQPETQAGRFYNLRGLARRAIRIVVDDADIQAKYGIDHYYEVDVFLPLPRALKLIDPRDGHSRLYDTYPVTFCVRRLPENMPLGPSIRQEVQICGSYMKLWSYRNKYVSNGSSNSSEPRRRQRSPLFIAETARVIDQKQQPHRWPEYALVGGFLIAIVVIGFATWSYSKGDKAFAARRRERPDRIPDNLP